MNPFKMPLQNLSAIASAGGVLILITVYYVRNQTVKAIYSTPAFNESVNLLKNHEGAKYLLGSPLTFKKFDVTNPDENVFNGLNQKFAIPVQGPHGNGTFFIKLICNLECRVSSCELELSKTSKIDPEKYMGKRLIILKDVFPHS